MMMICRPVREVVAGLVGIQWRNLFDVAAVEVVYVGV